MNRRIGVIAGAFNPVTIAHTGLAEAALARVDEIVFAIPRTFPHKEFEGASLEHRLEMVRACGYRVETTEGGLYVEIASEIQAANPSSDIYVACGRDAAERILNWNYDSPEALARMFQEFRLLVAHRGGAYQAPEHLRDRIQAIDLAEHLDQVSSSEVRRRIAAGERWEHLVPKAIVEMVRRIY